MTQFLEGIQADLRTGRYRPCLRHLEAMIGVAGDAVAVTGVSSDTLQVEWAIDGTFALDPAVYSTSDEFAYSLGVTSNGTQTTWRI